MPLNYAETFNIKKAVKHLSKMICTEWISILANVFTYIKAPINLNKV